jgi:hypothetical protein
MMYRRLSLLLLVVAVAALAPVAGSVLADDHDGDQGDDALHGTRAEIALMREAFSIMREFAEINRDPQAVAVIAVSTIGDYVEEPQEAVEMLSDLLPEVEDPVVQRTIRFKLAELHAAMGDQDEAIEHLRALILNRPAAER